MVVDRSGGSAPDRPPGAVVGGYRRLWLTVTGLAALIGGVAAVQRAGWDGVAAMLVSAGLWWVSRAHAGDPGAEVRSRLLLACSLVIAGTVVLAGWVFVAGADALWPTLLLTATCPWVLAWALRRRPTRTGPRRPAPDLSTLVGHRKPADGPARDRDPQPSGPDAAQASDRGLPGPPVQALSRDQLGLAWQTSYSALEHARGCGDLAAQARVVDARQAYLDELAARDPSGFTRWLATAGRPASNPAPFIRARPDPEAA